MLIWIIILATLLVASLALWIKTWFAYSTGADYIEFLENSLFDVNVNMNQALVRLRDIDLKGAFEADDEVGDVYTSIKTIILDLHDIVPQIENITDGETQEK